MSRTTSRLRRARDDEGFTLVEVLAALTVFALVATAGTAMFISALRASLMTKMDTTAKNLSQQQTEAIRNLPYHIDQVASPGINPPDLLDIYFVNATGTAGRGATGYVPAGAARWTADGDPATGAFYRVVISAVPGFPQYRVFVATQFLDDTGAPFTPPATFDTKVPGLDTAPTMTVGVGVAILWNVGQQPRTHRTYTQMTSGRPAAPTAVLQSRMTALRLSGGLSGGQSLTADLASLTSDGAVSRSVTGATAARAASLVMSTGQKIQGASSSAQAPPNAGPLSATGASQSLIVGGVTYGSFGNTSTSGISAFTSTGQPVLGTAANPARSDVLGSGGGARVATFAIDAAAPARLGLGTVHALVEDAGCGGSCSNIGAAGHAASTSSGPSHGVTTNATATLRGTLVLLPTTFAPSGLIRITLTSASVSCAVTRTGAGAPSPSATVSYSGTLSYFAPYAAGNVAGYVSVPLASTQAASPLTAALLTGTQVGMDSAGVPLMLSDYFTSWSSLNSTAAAGARTIGTDGTTAAASVSGMIGVTTVPLRTGDDTAVVGAQVGVGSCVAENYR